MVNGWWRLKPADPAALASLCLGAHLVVLRTGEGACPGARVLGGEELRLGGAAEVFREPGGRLRISWAQDARGDRPWTALAPAPDGD